MYYYYFTPHRNGNLTILVTVTSDLNTATIEEMVLNSFSSLVPSSAQLIVTDVERFGR